MIDRIASHGPRRPTLAGAPGTPSLRIQVSTDRVRHPRLDDLELTQTMLDLEVLELAHRDAIDAASRALHPALLEYLR